MFEQSKSFPKLVGLSALLIAGSAAFFSVFGLSKLFAGAALSVIVMAGSLEFGKIVGNEHISDKTKSIWYPKLLRTDFTLERYMEDPEVTDD